MRLSNEWNDREYREAYASSKMDTVLAMQIRVLREQRGWTQAELAMRMGTRQSRVSTMENCNYGGLTLRTLKRLAAVFDVPLEVSFGKWDSVMQYETRDQMERESYQSADAVDPVEAEGRTSQAPASTRD